MQLAPGQEAGYAKWLAANTKDPYSLTTAIYANSWARLMEQELAQGAQLADIAKSTAHAAGEAYDVPIFMFSCALGVLTSFWVHGKALKDLHLLNSTE